MYHTFPSLSDKLSGYNSDTFDRAPAFQPVSLLFSDGRVHSHVPVLPASAYLKAKERYDTQREKLAGRYKAKTVMYEALIFLLIWYSASTTLFQMIRSNVFISDCGRFFDIIATFIQTIAGCIVLTGKNVAQISDEISNPVIDGIIYWLIRILICGGCLVGAGILVAFIGIKIA